ncbi:hypothetical protein N8665_03915 [Akkermansiaceae bacterium]|nr:hypothetical protein [Akkermansiaceae bacterium]
MSWISNLLKGKFYIILYLIFFVLLVNPYTLSLLDTKSDFGLINYLLIHKAYKLIYTLHIVNLIGVTLFVFKRTIFIQLVVACGFVIIVDFAISPFVDRESPQDFRLKKPEPYSNADYFSPEFIDEAFVQPQRWILDDSYGGVKPANFEGRWFNVQNHRRITVNSDEEFKKTLYLFGGSTVYNSEVPDSLTIASQLAEIGANEASFEVVNMGASSIHSSQQFARLVSEVELKKGDIVVFYDGVNDVQQRIVYENKEGYMFGRPKNESFPIRVIRLAQDYSAIAKLLLDTMGKNVKPVSEDLVENSIVDYLQTLDEAHNHVINSGGSFFHFLQPTLFTKSNLSEYELMLIEKGSHFVPVQTKYVFERVYPAIIKQLELVKYSNSLTDSFDDLSASPYLDFCHVNHIGNQIIANEIWRSILQRSNH